MDLGRSRNCTVKRDGDKNHKILKFPILRASVKAYKNNLNTHKSYSKFREKRKSLRAKNRNIKGLGFNRYAKKLRSDWIRVYKNT